MADGPGRPAVTRLAMVYDADGGLAGEVRYVVGHLLGRAECALCDITHGTFRRKDAFDAVLARVGVPVDVVHRNEQVPELAAASAGLLPCVMAESPAGWELLVDRGALQACEGDVTRFDAVLEAALQERRAS